MSKLEQFNDILGQFFNELLKKFPKSTELKHMDRYFRLGKSTVKWVDIFMSSMKPYGQSIMEKDIQFLNSEFSSKLNLRQYYNECNDAERNIIWMYLQSLYLIGCAYENYTPEFMQAVSKVSDKCESSYVEK